MLPEGCGTLIHERYLGKDDPIVDYSVLSVGVMTLGLILIVEVLRHRIDHAAVGKPFFKTVLDGVYSECKLKEEKSPFRAHSCCFSGHAGHCRIHAIRPFHLLRHLGQVAVLCFC